MKTLVLFIGVILTLFTFTARAQSSFNSVAVKGAPSPQSPIMIQGPMPIEAEYFASLLDNVQVEQSGNASFYKGSLNGYPVVVVKTGKGVENTAAATAVGIIKYRPIAIINQGTSGGHDPALHVGDIVLGARSVNATSFKTPKRAKGKGSAPFSWTPMDLMASEESAGEGDSAADAEKIRYYQGDSTLMAVALSVKNMHKSGRVVKGTIGSGNFWNNELDRIEWLHREIGTSVEEMETSAAAQIAHAYQTPLLGIRILSNNATNHGEYDPSTAKACQLFVKHVVEAYIKQLQTNAQ